MDGVICSIDPLDDSTWDAKVFLTFDVDWAHDDVMADVVELLLPYSVRSTWFVTHQSDFLGELQGNKRIELGVHPNFNPLLHGDMRMGRNAHEVLDRLLDLVPGARSVRSHSITQSGYLMGLFESKGLTHECNSFIPWQTGVALKPWVLPGGGVRVPYFWEDDVACLYHDADVGRMGALAVKSGLRVFDFHPIHVFLNTENLERYENTRKLHHNPRELIKYRYDGYGTRNRLLELLEKIKQR